MLSLRVDPLVEFRSEIDRMRRQFDQLFTPHSRAEFQQLDPTTFPPVNCWEDENAFYVEAELPGLTLEDLEIFVTDEDTIVIKGQRQPPALSGTWDRRERGYGAFSRQVPLPGAVAAEEVEAALKHGVLTIRLPKAPELRPRKIAVKAS